MNSLGIFTVFGKPAALELARRLVALAEARGIAVRLQEHCALEIGRPDLACAEEGEIARGDVLITLGGDGAVLGAARAAAPHSTPVLAVDLGRLGFLSAVRPAEIERAFSMLCSGELLIEERMMLEAAVERRLEAGDWRLETESGAELPASSLQPPASILGLNDAVVAKSALARILRLTIRIGDELVAETRADGLIISTPTGSTAYAISAGGPIVHPEVPLLLICPICAHSLTQRPLVVAPHETVSVRAEWDGDEVAPSALEAMLTVDGQIGVPLRPGDTVQVRRSSLVTRLLHLPHDSFYERLRQKLSWS
jgi:NAD+ kinase